MAESPRSNSDKEIQAASDNLDSAETGAETHSLLGDPPSSGLCKASRPGLKIRGYLPFLLPFGVLFAVLSFSPNFQWMEAKPGEPLPYRENPYGADFLQDWVGGKIASVPGDRELLYPSDYANQMQHSGLVGFNWPKEKYFPMVYPPYYYWLVSPFSYFPYRWSAIAWTVLSTAIFALAGCLLYFSHPPLRNNAWPLMLAMTAFAPWIIALNMGQKSTWILLLFVAAYGLFSRDLRFLAGMVFGLVAIKPQLGIVVGLAMMLNRQWAFAAGGAVTMMGLLVLTQCLDTIWLSDYENLLRSMGDYASTGGYQLHESHSLVGGLKFVFPSALNSWLYPLALTLAAVVVLMVSWDRGISRTEEPSLDRTALQFSNLVFGTVLVSPHLYTYDLTILLLPIVLVVSSLRKQATISGLESARPDVPPKEFGTGALVQTLVMLLFVLAGVLPTINLQTGVPWGMLLILGITFTLSWHLHICQLGSSTRGKAC